MMMISRTAVTVTTGPESERQGMYAILSLAWEEDLGLFSRRDILEFIEVLVFIMPLTALVLLGPSSTL